MGFSGTPREIPRPAGESAGRRDDVSIGDSTILRPYIGLVVLKTMEPSVPQEKQKRLKTAERVILVLLGLTAVAFLVKLFHWPR